MNAPTAALLADRLPADPADILALIVNAKAKAKPGEWPGTTASFATQALTLDMTMEAFKNYPGYTHLLRLMREAAMQQVNHADTDAFRDDIAQAAYDAMNDVLAEVAA